MPRAQSRDMPEAQLARRHRLWIIVAALCFVLGRPQFSTISASNDDDPAQTTSAPPDLTLEMLRPRNGAFLSLLECKCTDYKVDLMFKFAPFPPPQGLYALRVRKDPLFNPNFREDLLFCNVGGGITLVGR